MIKPIWAAVGGVTLLGVAGGIGVFVASSGGDEEVVQQVETVTPSASAAPSATQSASPAASETAAPTPRPTQGETLTYTDPTYGYSFDYLEAWFVVPPKDAGGLVYLYSYDLASVPAEDAGKPVPMDKLKVIFRVVQGVDEPVQEWLASQDSISQSQGLPVVVISQTAVVVGGNDAMVRVTEAEGVQSTSYFIPFGNGNLLVIGAVPANSALWPQFLIVISSLRFPQ